MIDEDKIRYIYTVMFFGAPLEEQPRQRLFLFSSLAAIYDVFSVNQIGCSQQYLYKLKVPSGTAYVGKRCIIKREPLRAKHHKKLEH